MRHELLQKVQTHIEKLQALAARVATAPEAELVPMLAEALASQGCVEATIFAKKDAANLSSQMLRNRVAEEIVFAHNTLVDRLIGRLWPDAVSLSPEALWARADSVDNTALQAAVRKRAARDAVVAVIQTRLGAPEWCEPSWATHWYIGGRLVRIAETARPWYSGGPADLEIAIGRYYPSAHMYLALPCPWEQVQAFAQDVLRAIDRLNG